MTKQPVHRLYGNPALDTYTRMSHFPRAESNQLVLTCVDSYMERATHCLSLPISFPTSYQPNSSRLTIKPKLARKNTSPTPLINSLGDRKGFFVEVIGKHKSITLDDSWQIPYAAWKQSVSYALTRTVTLPTAHHFNHFIIAFIPSKTLHVSA